MTWPAQPLRSSPITGPSSLLRAGPPLCLASVLSPSGLGHPGFSLSTTRVPTAPSATGRSYRERQILLFHARACNELTPPLHRTPPGPRAGSSLAPDTPSGAPLSRGRTSCPGFDVIVYILDASAVVYTCSSSRRSPDPLVASLLRSRFPPRLLTGMTLRWFGISACTANPEGLPPSLAQHGSCWRSSTSSSLPFQDTHVPVRCRAEDRRLRFLDASTHVRRCCSALGRCVREAIAVTAFVRGLTHRRVGGRKHRPGERLDHVVPNRRLLVDPLCTQAHHNEAEPASLNVPIPLSPPRALTRERDGRWRCADVARAFDDLVRPCDGVTDADA